MRQPSNEFDGTVQPSYRKTMFDRLGPDAALYLRAAPFVVVTFVCVALLVATLRKKLGFSSALVVPVAVIATGGITWTGLRIASTVGDGVGRFVVPTGESTPYEHQFSREDALAARGETDAALESFEAAIGNTPITSPLGVSVRVRAAELYVTTGDNPQRAAQLYREVQRMDGVAASQDIYVSNRLIDLLLGPLDQPARALVELRRIVERYPASSAATHARTAIATIKRQLG